MGYVVSFGFVFQWILLSETCACIKKLGGKRGRTFLKYKRMIHVRMEVVIGLWGEAEIIISLLRSEKLKCKKLKAIILIDTVTLYILR